MPDTPPVVPGSTSPTTPPAEGSKATNGPEYATKAELTELQKLFDTRLQEQSGMLGGIRNDLKGLKPKPPENAEPKTLTQRQAADDQRAEFQTKREKFGALKAAAMDRGVPEKRAAQFARYILGSDNASNILVKEAGYEYVTEFRESDDSTVSISEWVGAFLKTEEGELFLPPKAAGSSDGQSGSGKGAAAVSPYLAMTFEQIMDAKNNDSAGFMTYLQEHEADWIQKQKSWKPKR